MISRTLSKNLETYFFQGKIIILTGPRQVGKTTLIEGLLRDKFHTKKVVTYLGEHLPTQELWGSQDLIRLRASMDHADIIFIDEGQKIPNIGESLKLLIDAYKNTKQIIVTGSSSFHLMSQVSESLAGRKRVFMLHPISYAEYSDTYGADTIPSLLPTWLIYGMYPAVLSHTDESDKREELADLTSSALYRDILEFQDIRNPALLTKLLKLLALQIGQEVSLHALGQSLSLESRTVERYIDLLEKSYIIYRIPPYFTNKKKEIIKTQKIYFYDIGIRNALLGSFQSLDLRADVRQLWENWVFSEWRKKLDRERSLATLHFWRGRNQQEIDLLESRGNTLSAYEIKWGTSHPSLPSGFRDMYGETDYHIISPAGVHAYLG